MKVFKIILILLSVVFFGHYFTLADDEPRWQNICKGASNPYCVAVGKTAKNNDAHSIPLRGLLLGEIIGVVWKETGEIVSNAGENEKRAPKNGYYYIVDNEISEPFLKLCSEVEVKEEEPYQGFSPGQVPLKSP